MYKIIYVFSTFQETVWSLLKEQNVWRCLAGARMNMKNTKDIIVITLVKCLNYTF